jgi:hypothetical protein
LIDRNKVVLIAPFALYVSHNDDALVVRRHRLTDNCWKLNEFDLVLCVYLPNDEKLDS